MLAMMQHPNEQDNKLPAAHPGIWASSTLVGEGGSSADVRTELSK
jgi:hypothetical protein